MLISIVMPAYNAEKTISQAIHSVIAQTYRQWELLVVNDQSNDNTKNIVLALAELDKRIRYIENRGNLGVSETRNRGVSLAQGQWIAFLDSDDMWEQEKLAIQADFLMKSGARFTFTGSAFMDQEGNRLDYCLNVPSKVSFRQLLKQNVISCSSTLIEKNLLEKYPMASGNMHEDYATWLNVLKNEHIDACGIDKPLLIYRVSTGSKSGDKGKAALMHWRVYRHIGLPILPAMYYFLFYMVKNLKKYGKIWKELRK